MKLSTESVARIGWAIMLPTLLWKLRLRRISMVRELRSSATTDCLPGGFTSNSTQLATLTSSLRASSQCIRLAPTWSSWWVSLRGSLKSATQAPFGMAIRRGLRRWAFGLRVHVFIEYMAIDVLMCLSAPNPARGRGGMPHMASGGRWLGPQPAVRSSSDIVLCSVCSHSQLSCRPQPRESDGDVTSRKDTRQDC